MMAIFKKLCLIMLFIAGTALAAPAASETTLPANELVQLINYEESVELITEQILQEKSEIVFDINGYYNTGFEYNSKNYGIAYIQTPEKTTVKQKKLNREMTQSLASRNILIPLLQRAFAETTLPQILLYEYLTYQILNGAEFAVDETFRIKFLNQNQYTGYCYIVNSDQLALLSTTQEMIFLQELLKDPRQYAEIKEVPHAIKVFEYCVENQDKNALDFSTITKIKLYLSALYLNQNEKEMAEQMLSLLPANLSEVFARGHFTADDYLLLGDLNLIFNNEEQAFSAWGYGIQRYPLYEAFEERFEKYSTE